MEGLDRSNTDVSQTSDQMSIESPSSLNSNDNVQICNFINCNSFGNLISDASNSQALLNQFDVQGNYLHGSQYDNNFTNENNYLNDDFDQDKYFESFEYEPSPKELEKENIPPTYNSTNLELTDEQEYENYLIRKYQSCDRSILNDITSNVRDIHSERQTFYSSNFVTQSNFTLENNFNVQIEPELNTYKSYNHPVKKRKNKNSITL